MSYLVSPFPDSFFCPRPLWLYEDSCRETVSAQVHVAAGLTYDWAHSSSQNGGSFPTVRFEFPDDSSSPLDAKRMSHLEVTRAKWVLSGTVCFVHFLLKMFSFNLLVLGAELLAVVAFLFACIPAYYMSNCGSLVGRNYSIARMCEHYCLWICKLLVQAVLENLRQSRPHPNNLGPVFRLIWLHCQETVLLGVALELLVKHLPTSCWSLFSLDIYTLQGSIANKMRWLPSIFKGGFAARTD